MSAEYARQVNAKHIYRHRVNHSIYRQYLSALFHFYRTMEMCHIVRMSDTIDGVRAHRAPYIQTTIVYTNWLLSMGRAQSNSSIHCDIIIEHYTILCPLQRIICIECTQCGQINFYVLCIRMRERVDWPFGVRAM